MSPRFKLDESHLGRWIHGGKHVKRHLPVFLRRMDGACQASMDPSSRFHLVIMNKTVEAHPGTEITLRNEVTSMTTEDLLKRREPSIAEDGGVLVIESLIFSCFLNMH